MKVKSQKDRKFYNLNFSDVMWKPTITANSGSVSQVRQREKTGEDGKGKYLGHLYLSSIQQKTLYMIEFLGITKDNTCTIVTIKEKLFYRKATGLWRN